MDDNSTSRIIGSIREVLWNEDIDSDVFMRWSQGFYFSGNEKSSLEQQYGGPCAVIAPVQAFILKKLLVDFKGLKFRMTMTAEMQREVLIYALCEILHQCSQENYLIAWYKYDKSDSNDSLVAGTVVNAEGGSSSKAAEGEGSPEIASGPDPMPDAKDFHEKLVIHKFKVITDVRKFYKENVKDLGKRYAILLFLYSVIATKDPEVVKLEAADSNELLIDNTYGWGSQCLINLMITGRAVNNVFDNNKDVGGLKLKGISQQSQIGFITTMEHLRLITVGHFYKNPVYPIWILGSDTHLTVLFSDNMSLVSPETKSEKARRIFKSYDPHDNNFITTSSLKDVLQALDLCSEQEYINVIASKLDGENLGIILLNAFMEEFFPVEESSTPDIFQLIHYNGLPLSNVNKQVQYHFGSAILLESHINSLSSSNLMLACLQTKWPSIDVQWSDDITPSLN